jgi:hypothetical protein
MHRGVIEMKLREAFLWNGVLAVAVAMLVASFIPPASARQGSSDSPAAASPVDKPYLVEWVYKVRWGYADEFWQIFKKYQIATLNREKELGYVTSYTVYRPGLHTGEDTRWEYRVVITYKNQAASSHGAEVEKELFPDRAAQKQEENRRWQITEAHYDLPIHIIDPNGDGTE